MNEEQTKMFEQLFGGLFNAKPQPAPAPVEPAPKEVTGYFCNKCDRDLHSMQITTTDGTVRTIFYCSNNQCVRFGLVTVVAKLKKFI